MKYISKQIKKTAGMEVGVVSGLWDCVGLVKESLEGHEIKIDPIYSLNACHWSYCECFIHAFLYLFLTLQSLIKM